MSLFSKLNHALVCMGILISLRSTAQTCNLTVKGFVLDESTSSPLDLANIYIQETKEGIPSDSLGRFVIRGLCPGSYHLHISHLGGETEQVYFTFYRDTSITILLHHHTEMLNELVVHGSMDEGSAHSINSINKDEISRNANRNLGDILQQISGVHVIKNGSGISKPIIHGLYGNRITLLNNGLVQAGQQWGNDHAPEIDPFMSDHVSVIKGAAALAYGGNGLGSIILIENNSIAEDPHLHGQFNYIFQTNSRGHTFNTRIQKYHPFGAWRLTGTIKQSGDARAPSYFLTNTGKNEYNLGLQMDKKFSNSLSSRLHLTTFNSTIGILRGSHIGNVTDLEEAITRTIPFFTKNSFSYGIESPKQNVHHHLFKLENRWKQNDRTYWSFNVGSQWNKRAEYDVRRNGRSELPALSLNQYTQMIEVQRQHQRPSGLGVKTGVQMYWIDNTNVPGTGILPLIPDFRSFKPSGFITGSLDKKKYIVEGGIRLDCNYLTAYTITKTLPRRIEKQDHQFKNFSTGVGFKYRFTPNFNADANLGYVLRSPEVNELYSNGLHQGVAGIEEGNPNLHQEQSIKAIVSADIRIKEHLLVQALAYYHTIWDYIYLEPQPDFRLTIRGAFPFFKYKQTDARLIGLDGLVSYEWWDRLKWISKYSVVSGTDITNNQGLIYMPAASLDHSLQYSFMDHPVFRQTTFGIMCKQVFKQTNSTLTQDILPPPAGYTLFGVEVSTSISIGKSQLKGSMELENLFNVSYRDYLNRLRYFSNEAGRNISIRINYSF